MWSKTRWIQPKEVSLHMLWMTTNPLFLAWLVWQRPLNLKFEVSFLTEKHKCTLFVCLSFTVCYFLLNRRTCVVRGQFQNSTTESQSKLESWKTKTLQLCHCLVSNHPWVFTWCKELPPKRTKEHGNVMTVTEGNQTEGIERFKSDNSFISLSLTLITQADRSHSSVITANNNSCYHPAKHSAHAN